MMELLGPMPKSMALGGVKYKKMFDRAGQLRRIKGLNYWPLHKVLHEKYKMKEADARSFADFLLPMLEWDPEKRASAQDMLNHPWLHAEPNYNSKMSAEELEIKFKKDELKKQRKDLA
jgi:serine/threonine-protein kinase SRPK3